MQKEKANRAGVTNIAFAHAGFLTHEQADQSVDAIVITFAFHHLPDFWNGIALIRMHRMLKPGGKLYFRDVILPEHHALKNIAPCTGKQAAAGGGLLREDAEGHFREEYSTYDWVMDGLLVRAGFTIKIKNLEDGVLGMYLCTKPSDDPLPQ